MQNRRKHPFKSWCPKCESDWRYRENDTIICSECGYITDAKRKLDKFLLPERSDEMLMKGGY